MGKIACNVSRLNIAAKEVKGREIIAKCTNNPLVQGIDEELAELVTAQAAMVAANDAYIAARSSCAEARAALDAAVAVWNGKVGGLAGVIEAVTDGDDGAILSTGYDLVAPRTPPQLLPAPSNVRAETNGEPGHTTVACDPVPGAKSYVVQKNADLSKPDGWVTVETPTKSTCDTNGVEPGTRAWFRMAAVNAKGRSPWSLPVERPVM